MKTKAIIFSLLLPGFGLFYLGYPKLFLKVYFFGISLNILASNLSLNLYLYLLNILFFLAFIIFNLHLTIKKVKEPRESRYRKPVFFIFAFISGLLISWFATEPPIRNINTACQPTGGMEPTIQVDEKFKYRFTDNFRRGDIVLFKQKLNLDYIYIKRLVGLPGDSIKVVDGRVFIDGQLNDNYILKLEEGLLEYHKKEIEEYVYNSRNSVNKLEQTKSKSFKFMNNLTKQEMDKAFDRPFQLFGSVYLPKKGDKIKLDSTNISVYKHLWNHENTDLNRNGDKLELIINEDYYFVLGDNRFNSHDSQFFGFLPKSHFLGKYLFTLY